MPFNHVIQTTMLLLGLGFAIPRAVTSFITMLLLVTPGYCSFYQLHSVMHHGNWLWLGKC